ncbi:MAG: hypothetical protein WDZ85_02460 [Candidatus Paceibacterota bacterium]
MIKQQGSAKTDFLIFLAVVFVFFLLWIGTGGPARYRDGTGFFSSSFSIIPDTSSMVPMADGGHPGGRETAEVGPYEPSEAEIVIDGRQYTKSPWYGLVKIGRGNAAREYQPRNEYITLTAGRNIEPINITGWILENGRDRKLERTGGNTYHLTAERAIIPTGINVLFGTSAETKGPIILPARGRAVVTTGSPPSFLPIPLDGSFRTNICTGYLETVADYDFTPRLSQNCPRPREVAEGAVLEDACFDYLNRLGRCQTPVTDPFIDRDGDLVRKHLDGRTNLSNQCRAFVLQNFNYRYCVANNWSEEDFLADDWRVYLNRPFGMWDDKREVITLYDTQGRLVDQLKY